MADNSTFIVGSAAGSLKEAFDGLPPWATNKTAEDIEALLRRSLDVQTKSLAQIVKSATAKGQGLSADDLSKVNSELDDLIKNLSDENKSKKKSSKDEDDENKKRTKRWKNDNDLSIKGIAMGYLMVDAALLIKKAFVDNFTTYTKLNESGINLVTGFTNSANGFESLAELTASSGVRFTELQGTMLKYNSAVNAFTASKFGATVGQASKNLAKFGFSSKESAELLGSYLESQQGFSDSRNKTEAEVTKGLEGFGKRISGVSLVTGMMRGKILENLEALSKSAESTILMGQVGEEQAGNLSEFVASFKDQKLGKEILSMMTDAVKPLNTTFAHLQKTGGGAFAQAEMELVNRMKLSGATAEEMQGGLASFVSANKSTIMQMMQQNKLLEQAGSQDAALANEHLQSLLLQEKNYNSISAADRKKIEATNKARADFSSAWEKLISVFQRLFTPIIPVMSALTTGMEKLVTITDHAAKFVGAIDTSLTKFINGFLSKEAQLEKLNLVSILGGVAAGLLVLRGVFKYFGKGLLDIFSKKKGSKVADWTTSLGADGSGGSGGKRDKGGGLLGSIGSGLAGLGKGIAGLGKGIGGAVSGMLQGLAKGLSALGSPKVLLGTLALAGVSAALWIAGDAMRQFINVKWEDLGKAGVAILGLSVAALALSALAIPMATGALVLTAMSLALGTFGTAVSMVGTGFSTISTGIALLTNSLTNFTGLDKLKDIISTINSINLLKAAAFAALSIITPVSATVPKQPTAAINTPSTSAIPKNPAPSTIDSPSAVPAKSAANNNLPNTTNAQLPATAPKSNNPSASPDISSTLTAQTNLLQQILLALENNVSVSKDILKYSRISA